TLLDLQVRFLVGGQVNELRDFGAALFFTVRIAVELRAPFFGVVLFGIHIVTLISDRADRLDWRDWWCGRNLRRNDRLERWRGLECLSSWRFNRRFLRFAEPQANAHLGVDRQSFGPSRQRQHQA